jgi:hypothetical protein
MQRRGTPFPSRTKKIDVSSEYRTVPFANHVLISIFNLFFIQGNEKRMGF